MKTFYKTGLIFFILGLVLIGISGVVTFMELSKFDFTPDTNGEKQLIKTESITLPDNINKIGYYSYDKISIASDDSLSGNNAFFDTYALSGAELSSNIQFTEDNYLKNEKTDKFSTYPINILDLSILNNSNENEFDSFLKNIKEKKFYTDSYKSREVAVTLRVSPDAYERFVEIPNYYTVLDYDEYTEEKAAAEEESLANERYGEEYNDNYNKAY